MKTKTGSLLFGLGFLALGVGLIATPGPIDEAAAFSTGLLCLADAFGVRLPKF